MTTPPPVAVVTGAGRGIGRAVARHLAAVHTVIAVARTAAELEETASGYPGILTHPADMGAAPTAGELAALASSLGRLSVWVNNAAVLGRRPLRDITDQQWDRVLGVNLDGAFRGSREALRAMSRTGGGLIVNIASLSGVPLVEKFAGLAAYNVSKAGLIALTEAVALEGREAGVACIALSLGAVDTAMLHEAAPHLRAGLLPDDVAALVDLLLSPAAAHLSGSNLPVLSNR